MKVFYKKLLLTLLLSFIFWEARWAWYLLYTPGVEVWVQYREYNHAMRAIANDRYMRRCPDALPKGVSK